jgi:uncharacterized Ntn-hydrolase superfamily protein
MRDFQKGKIYKITGDDCIYYGSTTSAFAVLTNVVTVPASAVISSIVYKTDSTFTAGTVKVYGVN